MHGTPLDSNHPGVVNLSPKQRNDLISLERKQDRGQPLKEGEEERMGEYKNEIAHGSPIESSHPGIANLTELEKDKLHDLEKKGRDMLSPQECAVEDKLRNEIAYGSPLNEKHIGMVNLSPDEAKTMSGL